MNKMTKTCLLAFAVAGSSLLASQTDAATYRYRLDGNWTELSDGSTSGWLSSGAVPGTGDTGRINWGGNTVTVDSDVADIGSVLIGVDESGKLLIADGGSLTTTGQLRTGNNGRNATGTLEVQNGGTLNIGSVFWSASNNSSGVIDIQQGGVVNVGNHLWWGVSGTTTVNINGTVQQTNGILGLGTNNASTPTGGNAQVTVGDNGVLSLNNINAGANTTSIQPGSVIDLTGTGELRLPGDFVGVLQNYVDAGKITGEGSAANVAIDTTTNPGFTTAYVVPEPSSLALVGLSGMLFARRRRSLLQYA